MSKYPKRAVFIKIEVGADTWAEAVREAQAFVDHLDRCPEDHRAACNMVTGGYSSGGFLEIALDPAMTHDAYFEALEAARKDETTPSPSAGE